MNTFKTQQELHRFLLDGGAIQYTETNDIFLYKDGFIVNRDTGKKCVFLFTKPEDWKPYVKKEWYEQIPDGGFWCSVYGNHNIVLVESSSDGILYNRGLNAVPISDEIKPITKEFYEEMGKHIYE